jgi:hypothetical protein
MLATELDPASAFDGAEDEVVEETAATDEELDDRRPIIAVCVESSAVGKSLSLRLSRV